MIYSFWKNTSIDIFRTFNYKTYWGIRELKSC